MNETMTLTEAIELLNTGAKIIHESFSSHEYIYEEDGKMYFEDDVAVPVGWLNREQLLSGWSKFEG